MQQLNLDLILPPSSVGKASFPTDESPSYCPDWLLEQEALRIGDRVLWQGKPATVHKAWRDRAQIITDKDFKFESVPTRELTAINETVEVSVGNEDAAPVFPTQNPVGNEDAANPFPTQNPVGNEDAAPAFPTETEPPTLEIGHKYYLHSDGREIFLLKLWKKRARVQTRDFEPFNVDLEDISLTSVQLTIPGLAPEVPCLGQPQQEIERLRLQGEKQTLEKRIAHYTSQIKSKLPPYPGERTKRKLDKNIAESRQKIREIEEKLKKTVGKEDAAEVFPTQNSVGKEDAANPIPSQNSVGNEQPPNSFPTQNSVGKEQPLNPFPTDLDGCYLAIKDLPLSQLRMLERALLVRIAELDEDAIDEPLRGGGAVHDDEEDDLPLEVPDLYIEIKKLPYRNKQGVKRYRGPYYYLIKVEGGKKSSTYICPVNKPLPEKYQGFPVYGEDLPF
jgi:hypothetical protein